MAVPIFFSLICPDHSSFDLRCSDCDSREEGRTPAFYRCGGVILINVFTTEDQNVYGDKVGYIDENGNCRVDYDKVEKLWKRDI